MALSKLLVLHLLLLGLPGRQLPCSAASKPAESSLSMLLLHPADDV
jgi:hypothetical protein